ncbi:DNA translocase FtsK [Desulfoferrobacter suflitae]|uniref:DNA translocase FtsK n=1 Tax=Desulfoferrobacter suflitae TaxID=2865782 RepID=UPI00216435CB|nr:DNA translocase FtsK [Desulfoferrobacter suflitae]MCK8602643.1 DNA translocase FtsK 4TM domain-containing protein [Desulfoferrobacter suflitae]
MDQKKHEIWAVCVAIPTLLVFFSLLSFHSSDLTLFNASSTEQPSANWIGFPGANLAWILYFLLGIGAYGIPLAGFWVSWLLFRGQATINYGRLQLLGAVLLLLSGVSLLSIHYPVVHIFGQEIRSGGWIGLLIAATMVTRLHEVGAHVLLVGVFLISLLLATPFSLQATLSWTAKVLQNGRRSFTQWVQQLLRRSALRQAEAPPVSSPTLKRITHVQAESSAAEPVQEPILPIMPSVRMVEKGAALSPQTNHPGQYALPSLDILDNYQIESHKPNWKKLEENSAILEQKLADFGVQGKVTGICPGPVITMYEYTPAPGIKISRIVGLSDDLSMALKAISIRVVAPIPGKAAIGIEIPNQRRELVSIRAVLESEVFCASTAPLTMALGQDTTGQPVAANLAKMPHLLIAGATGTGKSVGINTILSSLLYRNTPDDVRLLLIDPKRIELNSYEGIPHLIHPVVTDAKLATKALRWAVQEMELRYKLLADKNVRNIESYNKVFAKEIGKAVRENHAAGDEGSGLAHHHLPYTVIVIDELADLMMVASREVEESIIRLAQMARAAGIHLILATQRPSVDVLTGIIKANIPTRISFQVSSRIDSRTILDNSGAESLLGSGDMLFLPPGTAKLQRIHGAFVSEAEVQRLTQFWRMQQIREDPLRDRVNFQEESSLDELSEEDLDEKYDEAVQLVLETRQASISMLQRRLRVGYNRAARMIEVMEQQGIVGPSDGVKPREVLTVKTP